MTKYFSIVVSLFLFGVSIYSFASERTPGDQFAIAIESGDLEKIKALVEGGAKADTLIEYGEHKITPLMKACWDGEMEIATYLMDQGADVNAADESGTTPLFNAVARNRPEFVQLLIDRDAKVNVKDSRQFTPLTNAAAAGAEEISRILVKAGADILVETYGLTPLMFAVASRKIPMVKLLVELGAPVDQVSSLSGQTALFSAIYSGSAEMVQALIDLKANVNFRTKDGDTPVKAAQKGDQFDIIDLLKAAGAKEEVKR
ncbi:ankyrin repeat domain-containing protein [bacterium]|nr:ankyrin repeat domain-containing protein [bacterium]MCI0606267.1 ankyrin repeat domain-containing protein [bacterium]